MEEKGLDIKYWISILLDCLSISSTAALKYVSNVDFAKLNKHIRFGWEKEALMVLMEIKDDSDSTFKMMRAAAQEKAEKRKEDTKKLIEELNDLKEKGKNLVDKDIEEKIKKIRSALEIPDSVWISQEKTDLNSVIKDFESMVDDINAIDRKELSERDILENASAGLALKGILKGKQFEEGNYRQVISIPSDVKFRAPAMSTKSQINSFTSKTSKSNFIKLLDSHGYSLAASVKGFYELVAAEGGGCYKKNEEKEKEELHKSSEMYYSQVKYQIIPLASFTFIEDKLRLTEACITELSKLEFIIAAKTENEKRQQQQACEEFFKKYGSHVNCGPIHFGGTFYWISEYWSKDDTDKIILKNLSEVAMGAFVNLTYAGDAGVSTNGNVLDLNCNWKGDYEDSVLEKTSFRVETKGGPPECFSLIKWKTGLVSSNATWSIVDRGHNFKGIWELMKNHSDSFIDNGKFESILCNAWQNMTGLQAILYLENKDLLEIKNELDDLLTKIPEFLTDLEFPKYCVKYLEKIAMFKTKFAVITHNLHAWNQVIQKNTILIELMETTWKNKDNYDQQDLSIIKYYLKQILADAEDFEFDSKTKMKTWIHFKTTSNHHDIVELKASDIISFVSNVKSYVLPKFKNFQFQDNKEETEEEDKNAIEGTCDLSLLSRELLTSLKENEEINLYNLLQIILLQINFNLNVNGGYLSYYDVTFQAVNSFLEELNSQHEEFLNIVSLEQKRINGFVLGIAYQVADKKNENKFQAFLEIFNMLELNEECIEFINKYATPLTEWDKLKSAIDSLKDGTDFQSEKIGENFGQLLDQGSDKMTNTPSMQDERIIESSNNGSEDVEKIKIIDQFRLSDFYPSKITVADVRKKKIDEVVAVSDLPWVLLQKILLLNYRSRNELHVSTKEQDQSDDEENDENLLDQLIGEDLEIKKICFNPMDVVAAVFLCSSNFLKQLLSQKLCMTKLSIPFLLPDVDNTLILQKWSLRDIILNGKDGEISAFKSKMPIVTFVRFGEIPRSKSKLLNELLCNSSHNIFFHKDCTNGNVKGILSHGSVDAAWYIPSTRARCYCNSKICKCHFNDTMMFLNLHGKCEEFENQANVLCRLSNMMVIMVDLDEIEDPNLVKSMKMIAENSEKILLIVTRKQGSKKTKSAIKKVFIEAGFEKMAEDKRFDIFLDFKDGETGSKNLNNFKAQIITKINKHRTKFKINSLMETLKKQTGNSNLFVSDEDNKEFLTGQLRAKDMHLIITKYELHKAKTIMLPLQGKLWKDWGKIKKEENIISKKHGIHSIDEYVAKLYKDRQDLRRRQFDICENLSSFMTHYITNLLELNGDTRLYFMHILRMNLDELSRTELPAIEQDFSSVWSDIQNNQNKDKRTSVEIDALKLKLKILENKLDESSLGLEHLVREMGQMFEAVTDLKEEVSDKVSSNIGKLPKIMAGLLLAGNSVEIMDGNTAYVPLNWIQAVFSEVKLILGEKKVFVLSVLGIQSSGKSTLLNAMFGVQFAVKTGRCTQGVFAQLVHLPENLGYDYIMVVDTEGLRAPELRLEKHKHDNELATLAIGIADLTLINIKGENHAEIQDVLQIVVHAFVRMQIVIKNLNLKASCFFIHQNVGADDAEAKIKRGKIALIDKLNKMTQAAAHSENVTHIEKFTDVINFDVENNVKYFPNLWQGEPPMAPVNPGYSEKVEDVKKILYKIMSQKSQSQSTIEQIKDRIGDLWKGILADDFVFSFRNILEIRAYQSLDLKNNDLSFKMKNDVVEWLNNQALGTIRGVPAANLESVKTELELSLKEIAQKAYEEAFKALNDFFENSEEAEILEQWKETSKRTLINKKEDIERITLKSINGEVEIRKLKIFQNKQLLEWIEQISKETSDLAVKLRGKNLNKEELNSNFNFMWAKMVAKQPPKAPQSKVTNVKTEVHLSLLNTLSTSIALLNEHLETKELDSPVKDLFDFEIKDEYFSAKTYFKLPEFMKGKNNRLITIVREFTQQILKEIPENLKKIEDQNFSKHHVEIMLKKVVDLVQASKENNKCAYILKQEYKVSLLVHICRFSLPKFKRMREDYNKKIDPKIEENLLRDQLFIKFKNIYEKKANEKIVADQLCHIINIRVKEQLSLDLPQRLLVKVRDNHSFMASAGLLKKQVMKKLLELDSFHVYTQFLENNEQFIIDWLRHYTKEYLFKKVPTTYGETAKIYLGVILMDIRKAIREFLADYECDNQKEIWKHFIEKLKSIIPVRSEEVEGNFTDKVVKIDFKNLSSIMNENLLTIENDLKKHYEETTSLSSNDIVSKIADDLSETCIGCSEQCPFCKATCIMTSKSHCSEHHSVIEHYPQGVNGSIWEKSEKLSIDTCPNLVYSNNGFHNAKREYEWENYKDYKNFYPQWSIPRNKSLEISCYWKRFMAKFNSHLAKLHDAKEGDIPPAWHKFTKKQALESIEKLV